MRGRSRWRGASRPSFPSLDYGSILMPVRLFARLDADWQAVFVGRQRTRRVGSEGAGRVVSLVEIQHHLAIFGRIRIQESAGTVGFFSGGLVAEHEKQVLGTGIVEDRPQAVLLAVQAEDDVSRTILGFGLAEDVGNRNLLRIGDELRGNFVFLASGE